MSSIWRPLPRTAGLHGAAVLLKYSMTSSGYSVHLTDLSQVWSEELSKATICARARSTDCSIDPTEDNDQLNILSAKIEAALRGDDETSLAIVADGADHITLTTTSPLPNPLPPLTWFFQLGPGSREQVKTEVMVPLVCSTYMRKQQQDDLVALIAQKDILINKLVDKIESVGSELSSLYPNLARIRPGKNQRQQLAKHVKGLDQFDEGSWRKEFDSKIHDGLAFRDMSEVAFRESGTKAVDGLLLSLDSTAFRPLPEVLKTGAAAAPRLLRVETKDEFQHQITPKKIRKKRAIASGLTANDDETTDDAEADSPTPGPLSARTPYRNSSPVKSSSKSARKLGRIGGSKASHSQSDTKPPSGDIWTLNDKPGSSEAVVGQSRKWSVAESTSESPIKSGESTSAAASLDTNKFRRNFGKIGGKQKLPPAAPTEVNTHTSVTPEPASAVSSISPAPQPHPRQQLGRLGGRRSESYLTSPAKIQESSYRQETPGIDRETKANVLGDAAMSSRTPTPQPEEPEESQEERAARHRAELKREASAAKKLAPKRRKF